MAIDNIIYHIYILLKVYNTIDRYDNNMECIFIY